MGFEMRSVSAAVVLAFVVGCAQGPGSAARSGDGEVAALLAQSPEAAVMFPAISVVDLEASEAFYVEVLGLKPSLRLGDAGSAHREVTLNATGDPASPGASLVLDWVASHDESYAAGALSRVAFRVRDLDAVLGRVRDAGHPVLEEPRTIEAGGIHARLAFVEDPGGVRVELIELLSQ